MEEDEFDDLIRENLDKLEDLDELNEAQRHLRLAILLILSDRDYEKFQKLNKNIERTKKLFRDWLEPL